MYKCATMRLNRYTYSQITFVHLVCVYNFYRKLYTGIVEIVIKYIKNSKIFSELIFSNSRNRN